MEDAPTYIKDKVIAKRIMECLRNTQLFSNCDQDFLHSVARDSVLKSLPEGTIVTSTDIKSSWIHVILR